jgi:Ca2+-binding RTX toxin-like protein
MFPFPKKRAAISPCAQPDFEELEGRCLRSVTVEQGYPGFYYVQGDSSNDTINISVTQANDSFTLDGTTYTGVSYIQVSGGDGDDTINVTSVDGSGDISAGITGDGGNDTINLNFDGAVSGGDGDDTITLKDAFMGTAWGDAGNDKIILQGANVAADIEGGDGDDLIDATASDCGLYLQGGAGNDTILGSEYNDQIDGGGGTNSLVGNGGNDAICAEADSSDTVDGGADGDVLYSNGSDASVNNVEYIYYD